MSASANPHANDMFGRISLHVIDLDTGEVLSTFDNHQLYGARLALSRHARSLADGFQLMLIRRTVCSLHPVITEVLETPLYQQSERDQMCEYANRFAAALAADAILAEDF